MSNSPYHFNPQDYQKDLLPLLSKISGQVRSDRYRLEPFLRQHPKVNSGFFSKAELIKAFNFFHSRLDTNLSPQQFANFLKKKPVRSLSGVTPVTVLTKPFPCPGKCIFCPSDVRMPKSYLSNEPGAQRATNNYFHPYLQTYNRLITLNGNGHATDKIELIVLGGTWSFYPETYQIWFILGCFQALNDFGNNTDRRSRIKPGSNFSHLTRQPDGSNLQKRYNQIISDELNQQAGGLIHHRERAKWSQLKTAQEANESSTSRCVGLVLETRPDHISPEEIVRLRRLGCTKAQIGFQSLSDKVLRLNHRGHTVAATRRAMKLLRLSGFKIHAHWMANLYGSDVDHDIEDFNQIFSDPDFKPDELKIYPCSLIKTAELMRYYQDGRWSPYTHNQLLKVLTSTIKSTPAYCRLTRVIRDIPGTDIVAGNKLTNFRQIAEQELDKHKTRLQDIRSREIKDLIVNPKQLQLKPIVYLTSVSTEHFLQYVTHQDRIAAYLRLSLPAKKPFIDELTGSAIIREIHVYGQAARVGEHNKRLAQHLGLGTKLFLQAVNVAKQNGYHDLAVISAVGTRQYYRKLGFCNGKLYQHFSLARAIV